MSYDIKARCKNKDCARFLKIKAIASSQVVVTCPDRKCKMENTIRIIMVADELA